MIDRPSFVRAARLVALLNIICLSACAGGAVPPLTQAANVPLSSVAHAFVRAPVSQSLVYAADAGGFGPGTVYVYKQDGSHQLPTGRFGQFSSPIALATDVAGSLYVPDWGQGAYDGRVYVFANPSSPLPIRTLDDKGALPNDLTVATDGTVYVANGYDQLGCGGNGGDVRVYLKGQLTAAYMICDGALAQPYSQVNGVAIDTKGDVFVTWEANTNTYGKVREFTPGPNFTGHFLAPRFKLPYAVAIDAAGNIVVSDVRVPAVEVFAPGSKTPKYTFAQTGDPTRFAFDASGSRIFVSDAIANQIDEYDYPGGNLINTIAFPGGQLDGIALTPPWTGVPH